MRYSTFLSKLATGVINELSGKHEAYSLFTSDTEETAYTTDRPTIVCKRFLGGQDLAACYNEVSDAFYGILLHELMHHKQPTMKDIADSVRNFDHRIANILLDINDEANLARMNTRYSDYLVTLRKELLSPSKPLAYSNRSLKSLIEYVRFGNMPYSPAFFSPGTYNERQLEEFIRELIASPPSLCLKPIREIFELIEESTEDEDSFEPSEGTEKGSEPFFQFSDKPGENIFLKQIYRARPVDFSGDEKAIGACLHFRMQGRVPKRLSGFGELDLNKSASRDPIPFKGFERTPLQTERGKPPIVLCIDASSSMDTDQKWEKAAFAARSLAYACELSKVKLHTFAFAREFVEIENPKQITSRSNFEGLIYCNDTVFYFLETMWERFSESKIIVVTDGQGKYPAPIRPENTYQINISMPFPAGAECFERVIISTPDTLVYDLNSCL